MDLATSRRPSVPHVITQWQVGQNPTDCFEEHLAVSPKSYHRNSLVKSRQKKTGDSSPRPRPNVPTTPNNGKWSNGSVTNRHQSIEFYTPISAGGDSIFELPNSLQIETPNSSTHSSMIAELEDTSCAAVSRGIKPPVQERLASIVDDVMVFKCTKIDSQAVIKVVDETIAAIEASNRELLNRAVMAEDAAQKLREQNSTLQVTINHCKEHHRPKTAPGQPVPSPRRSQAHIYCKEDTTSLRQSTPLSNFNTKFTHVDASKPRKSVPDLKAMQTYHAVALSQPLSPPSQDLREKHRKIVSSHRHNFPPAPTSTCPPPTPPIYTHSAPQIPSPLRPRPPHHHSAPPIPHVPPPATFASARQISKRGPQAGSAPQMPHLQIISLEEARRKMKPLPPLGPMSPSIIQGKVEIGLGIRESGFQDPDSKHYRKGRSRYGRRSELAGANRGTRSGIWRLGDILRTGRRNLSSGISDWS